MSTIIFANKTNPFLMGEENNWFFRSPQDFTNWDNEFFTGGVSISGGGDYNNLVNYTLNFTISKYGATIEQLIGKVYYCKMKQQDSNVFRYFWVSSWERVGRDSVTCNLVEDVWVSCQASIVFREKAYAYIKMLTAKRWSNWSFGEPTPTQLMPDFTGDSPLWLNDPLMVDYKNNIDIKTYHFESILGSGNTNQQTVLRLDSTNNVVDASFKNSLGNYYLYAVLSYTNDATNPYDYENSEFISTVLTPANNFYPFPFLIVVVGSFVVGDTSDYYISYNAVIKDPNLITIFASEIPLFTFKSELVLPSSNRLKTGTVVFTRSSFFKYVWGEDPPITDTTDGYLSYIRPDKILGWLKIRETNGTDQHILQPSIKNQIMGVTAPDNDTFNADREPKVHMYPHKTLELGKGNRNTVEIYNELLFYNEPKSFLNEALPLKYKVTLTPSNFSTNYFFNSGMYFSDSFSTNKGITVSTSQDILTQKNEFINFLKNQESVLRTSKDAIDTRQYSNFVSNLALSAVTAGTAGVLTAFTGGIAPAIAGVAGLAGLSINHFSSKVNFNLERNMIEAKLTDLENSPNGVNPLLNNSFYSDEQLLNISGLPIKRRMTPTLKVKQLAKSQKDVVAQHYHRYGYTIEKSMVVDNWDKLIIRKYWNYIMVNRISDCFNLELSNLDVVRLNIINEIFNRGVRLWNYSIDWASKIYNYGLANWEIGIVPHDSLGVVVSSDMTINVNTIVSGFNNLINSDGSINVTGTPDGVIDDIISNDNSIDIEKGE